MKKNKKNPLSNNLVQLAILASSVFASYFVYNKLIHDDSNILKKGEKFYYMINTPDGTPTGQNTPNGPNLLIGNNKKNENGEEIPDSFNILFPDKRFLSNSKWTEQDSKNSIFFTTLPYETIIDGNTVNNFLERLTLLINNGQEYTFEANYATESVSSSISSDGKIKFYLTSKSEPNSKVVGAEIEFKTLETGQRVRTIDIF